MCSPPQMTSSSKASRSPPASTVTPPPFWVMRRTSTPVRMATWAAAASAASRRGDLAEVDDRGVGRVQGGDPADVRSSSAGPFAADHPDPGHAVGLGPLVDRLQAGQLAAVERDHHLAALLVGQGVGGAELLQQADAPAAQPRLERPGHVVEAGVDHAAVASCPWRARSGSFSSTVTSTSSPMPTMRWARATSTMPPSTIPMRLVPMAGSLRLNGSAAAPPPEQIGGARGHPVEEQQPVQVVELVQQRPGLDVGLDQPGRPPGSRPGRRRWPGGHVAGQVGHAFMQPSRATAGTPASTSSGSSSTTRPAHDFALGWPVTSTQKARRPTPDLGRGQADAVVVGAHGVDQVGGHGRRRRHGVAGDRPGGGLEGRRRQAEDGPDLATLEDVGVVGVEADLDPGFGGGGAEVGLDLAGPAGGDIELEVHRVHRVGLAHHAGLEVFTLTRWAARASLTRATRPGRSAPYCRRPAPLPRRGRR